MSAYSTYVILLIVLFVSPLFSENHWDDYIAEKNIGSTYHVFGDNVNLRESGNLNAKVIQKLKLGQTVKILSKMNQTLEQNSVKEYWYQVQTESGGGSGYVWGGFISDYSFPIKDALVLCKNLGVKTRKLELKIIRDSNLISQGSWEVGPMSNESWDSTIYDEKGFSPKPNALFAIKYLIFSEIEYGYSNEQLFTFDQNFKIQPQFSWNPGACDPPACSESWLIFPKDTLPEDKKIMRKSILGKENTIIELMHSFDIDEPNQHDYYQSEYLWNGQNFQKKEN
ncbi:SH3 domain-containing protein [Leptospira jelokensis]|uniref:SH3 domain-containing protein n=1 Tax=Leptospira jelokensis TaxID=2484931 RepID=UPI001090C4C1|nr:SH3 domain-containing protein [Leptospira jelokensis]TGM01438.1 SH3 domain-containing protein [Leptospira jelokensis]